MKSLMVLSWRLLMGKSENYQTNHLTETKVKVRIKVRKTLIGVWQKLFELCTLTVIQLGLQKKGGLH